MMGEEIWHATYREGPPDLSWWQAFREGNGYLSLPFYLPSLALLIAAYFLCRSGIMRLRTSYANPGTKEWNG